MRVGLPKGRLLPTSVRVLERLGLAWRPGESYRLLRAGLEVWLLKMCDIPRLVASGDLDLGLAPNDWIEETGPSCRRTVPLDGYTARISVLATPERLAALAELQELRVATEYPNLARRFLAGWAPRLRIIEVHGSAEAYAPDLADVVVDCVETGDTARSHGLVEVQRLCDCDLFVVSAADGDDARRLGAEIAAALGGSAASVQNQLDVRLHDLPPSLRAPLLSRIRDDTPAPLDGIGEVRLASPRGDRPVYLVLADRDLRLTVRPATTLDELRDALTRFVRAGGLLRTAPDLLTLVGLLSVWDETIRELGLYPGRVYLASEEAIGRLLALVGAGMDADALHELLLEAQALDLMYRFPVAFKFRRAYGRENQCRLNGWGRRLAQRAFADPDSAALADRWRELVRAHLVEHGQAYADHIAHVSSIGLTTAPADSWTVANELPVPILL